MNRRRIEEIVHGPKGELDYLDFMVAGATIWSGQEFLRSLLPGEEVFLVRDAFNPEDANAIAISHRGRQIGWVPRELARQIAPLLDAGARVRAEIKKILTEGRLPIPVVAVHFYSASSAKGVTAAEAAVQLDTTLVDMILGIFALAFLIVLAAAVWFVYSFVQARMPG